MSAGNACAAIGLANTSKIPMIGGYLQDTSTPGPGAEGPYIGNNSVTYWPYNPVQETDYAQAGGYTAPATSGAATGKVARLVYTGASTVTVSADQTCAVSAGGVVTAGTGAAYATYFSVGTVIPAAMYLWVYLV